MSTITARKTSRACACVRERLEILESLAYAIATI